MSAVDKFYEWHAAEMKDIEENGAERWTVTSLTGEMKDKDENFEV